MIKFIPSLIENKIERDHILDKAYEDLENEKHSFTKSIEEAVKLQSELKERVKKSCSVFKGTCPEQWDVFQNDLIHMFGLSQSLDSLSPYDLIASQKAQSVFIDANYYAITKAYTRGQLDILDGMLKSFSINLNDFNPELSKKRMSFMKKVLTYLSSLID